MTDDTTLDPRASEYLEEGPTQLPLEDREQIARLTASASQRRRRLDRFGPSGQRWLGALAGSDRKSVV